MRVANIRSEYNRFYTPGVRPMTKSQQAANGFGIISGVVGLGVNGTQLMQRYRDPSITPSNADVAMNSVVVERMLGKLRRAGHAIQPNGATYHTTSWD